MNLAVYERGRPAFYALQRLDPRSACWRESPREGDWRFGDTTIRVTRAGGEVHLHADVDIALPGGERATGVVEVEGRERRPGPAEHAPEGLPRHDWSPVTACARGHARLSLTGDPFVVEGRAYHDRNGGTVPLWDLDIRRWLWGRVPFADEELIFFTLWRHDLSLHDETLLLFVDKSGVTRRAHQVDVSLVGDRLSWSGMRLPRAVDLRFLSPDGRPGDVRLRRTDVVDEGPFYVRFLAEAAREHCGGGEERALGFVEGIAPRRVDLARHRPFVRMRVHDREERCSPWLPLFCGRKRGRLSRLGRSWLPFPAGREHV